MDHPFAELLNKQFTVPDLDMPIVPDITDQEPDREEWEY